MLKRLIAGAASLALTLGGVALAATPAQALTGASCDDGDAWSWSIANPARYQAGPHEAVVGLSEAIRTVTIKAPTGCTVDAGDTWRVYNGYFSAAGTFNAEEAAAGKDTDRISVEVPTSNAVAGDEIPVKLKVNDSSAGIPGIWDVDDSNAGSLVLLRRTLFKYKGVTDWMNFGDEPYICGEDVEGAAPLLRASWTSKRYLGYAGRTVRMEYRLADGQDSAWAKTGPCSTREATGSSTSQEADMGSSGKGIDVRGEVVNLLLEQIASDRNPSATMMNMVEELLAPDDVPAYVGVLMDNVKTGGRYPSYSMLRRILALTS
jgi:hypothetical protein